MGKKSLVKITSLINHDYLKKWDQYMALLWDDCVQFVLKNWYPTLYSIEDWGKKQFEIEPLSNWFGASEFECDFGQNL